MNIRNTIIIILLTLFAGQVSAQLSFLSVLDSFPGSRSEFVPLPMGFLTFNGSFEDNEDYAFRMTKF